MESAIESCFESLKNFQEEWVVFISWTYEDSILVVVCFVEKVLARVNEIST